MSWIATAVIGAAVVGGIATNKASKRANEGQKEALQVTTAGTQEARGDITRLFGTARESRERAFGDVRSFLSKAPGAQIAPFQRGNILAQEQIARGLPQIQRAILGQPTDLSGFQARTVGAPESFNIDLSGFRRDPQAVAPITTPGATQARNFGQFRNVPTGGRSFQNIRGRIDRIR